MRSRRTSKTSEKLLINKTTAQVENRWRVQTSYSNNDTYHEQIPRGEISYEWTLPICAKSHACSNSAALWLLLAGASRNLFTSKCMVKGETILLCQKKKQLNTRARTSAKANLPVLRLASLCAKKWNTFAKANTAPDRRSRRSQLVSRKRGGRE